jgi:NAD(P)H-flavin reductase
MTKPQEYTAIFENKEIYNEKFEHYHFELKKPFQLDFKAGQFVSVLVNEQGMRRAYSICSDPDINHGIEILLDIAPQGIGVKYFQNLKFGDEIKFLAPMGRFVINDEVNHKSLTLIGTGSGIAPLHSMVVDQLKNKNDKRPIVLYWGLRHARHLVWQDEFTRWSKKFTNFSFHPTLSKPEKGWPLCRGRVTDCLSVHDLLESAGYYLCGSRAMIEDCKKILLERGVSEKNIYHEQFF